MHHPSQRPTTSVSAISQPTPDLIQLHAQAVNGLNAALYQLTSPDIEADTAAFNRALARSMRATAALKRACACTAVSVAAPIAVTALSGIASVTKSGGDK